MDKSDTDKLNTCSSSHLKEKGEVRGFQSSTKSYAVFLKASVKKIYICNENATKKFKFHKNVFTLGYGAKVLIRTRIILINDNIAGPAACTSRMLVCISRYIATATAYCCHKTIINKNVIISMT